MVVDGLRSSVVGLFLLATGAGLSAQQQRQPLAAGDVELIVELVRLEDTRTFDEHLLTKALHHMREIGCDPNAWLTGPVATSLFTRTPSTKSSGLLPSEKLA